MPHGYVRHEHCALAAPWRNSRKNGSGRGDRHVRARCDALITAPRSRGAHLPLVVFAGEAPLKSGWYNQEIDQARSSPATGAPITAAHARAHAVAIRDAFLQTRRERRPLVIGIPFDLQARPWDGPADLPRPRTNCCRALRDSAAPRRCAGAAKLLAARTGCRARRPGCGRSRSGRRLRALAARWVACC